MAESDCETVLSANLPHEVMVEILSYLPLKPLFRFRCVSKNWLQFLTLDSHFAKLHLDRYIESNPNPSVLANPCNRKDYLLALDHTACDRAIHLDLPFPNESGDDSFSLSGICDGLLCFNRQDDKEVYIWNPLTKDYITISCLPTPSNLFPEYNNDTMFGFGFDKCSGKYKVMRAFCESELTEDVCISHAQISVFTIGVDSSWRTVNEDYQYYLSSSNKFTLANGVLHWISNKPGAYSFDVIIGFDLKDEVFREVPPPSAIVFDMYTDYQKVGELGGKLCMFNRFDGGDVEIWLMMVYGVSDSWVKGLRIQKPENWSVVFFEPLGIGRNADLIISMNTQILLLMDAKTMKITQLKGFAFDIFLNYIYMGSLISPSIISRAGHSLTENET